MHTCKHIDPPDEDCPFCGVRADPSEPGAPVNDRRHDVQPGHEWNFYSSDSDRSNLWTNHGFSLDFICNGFGDTAEEAWLEALASDRVPEGWIEDSDPAAGPGVDTPSVAIRAIHEVEFGSPASLTKGL